MAINVQCSGCLKRFDVSDKFAGSVGLCPNCKTRIAIPVIIEEPEYPIRELENNRSSSMNEISQGVVVGFGLAVLIIIGMVVGINVTASPDELPDGGHPNLYELARQSAENTRYIFILLCAGWMGLFGFYLPYYAHKNLY